jgi:putative Holliday junction resolvase
MLDRRACDAQPAAVIRTTTSSPGTVLAFDFGTRWTGVAVGEHESGIAHPLTVIESRTAAGRLAAIAPLIGTWRPTHLVVGLPLTLSGGEHRLAGAVRRFGADLGERFALPVVFVDERLTSAEANDTLRASGRSGRAHKHLVHPVAAQHILHDYFGRRETQ